MRQNPLPFSFRHLGKDVTIIQPLPTFLRGIIHEVNIPRPGESIGIPTKLISLAVKQEGNRFLGSFGHRSHTDSMQGTKQEGFGLTEVDSRLVKPEIIRDQGQATRRNHDSEEGVIQGEEKILWLCPKLPVPTSRGRKHEAGGELLRSEHTYPLTRGRPLIIVGE